MKAFATFYNQLFEVSDRANVDITWSGNSAQFNAAGTTYLVDLEENDAGAFTVTFKNAQSGYQQSGRAGMAASAVFSGVLTTLREFMEMYEDEYGMKPYSFDFSAAYELAKDHPILDRLGISRQSSRLTSTAEIQKIFSRLDESEIKKLFLEWISRPMLYQALSLSFGQSYGYSVEVSDHLMESLAGNASDFRSVRKNVTRNVLSMSTRDLERAFRSANGSVGFMLTLKGANPSDYSSSLSIEDRINDADMYEIRDWIDQGLEDEILQYADWDVRQQIAQEGLMLPYLINDEDIDVVRAVVAHDPEYAEELVSSPDWERRVLAAEVGYGVDELILDDDSDVREAAMQHARDNYEPDDMIRVANNVAGKNDELFEEIMDYFIDYSDEWELRVYAAQRGYRIHDLLGDGDEDVRVAAIQSAFEMSSEVEAVDYIVAHSDPFIDDNLEYILDNMSVGSSAKDRIKELADEHDVDVSSYFD